MFYSSEQSLIHYSEPHMGFTKLFGRVVSTPALCLGGPGLKSRLEEDLCCLMFALIFPRHLRQMPG
jgi:hypothetical protein